MIRLHTRWNNTQKKWEFRISKDSNLFIDFNTNIMNEYGNIIEEETEATQGLPFEKANHTIEEIRKKIYVNRSYAKFAQRHSNNIQRVLGNQQFFPRAPLPVAVRNFGRDVHKTLNQRLDTNRITNVGPATLTLLNGVLLAIFGYMKAMVKSATCPTDLNSFASDVKDKTLEQMTQRTADFYNSTIGTNITFDAFVSKLHQGFEETINITTDNYNNNLSKTEIQTCGSNTNVYLDVILWITLVNIVLSLIFYCYSIYEKKQKQEYDILKTLLERLPEIEKEIALKEEVTKGLVELIFLNSNSNYDLLNKILENLDSKDDLAKYQQLHKKLQALKNKHDKSEQLREQLYNVNGALDLIQGARENQQQHFSQGNILLETNKNLDELFNNKQYPLYIKTLREALGQHSKEFLEPMLRSITPEIITYLLENDALEKNLPLSENSQESPQNGKEENDNAVMGFGNG